MPSLPGYAWSARPREPGWGIHHIADAWAEIMARLGYDRFVAGGSDRGTSVSTRLGRQHPDRTSGLFWFDSSSPNRPAFRVDVPTGALVFPAAVPRPSRRSAQDRVPRIVHWAEPDCGGHFGAWEQPETVARELRAFARTLA
jgi:pimeloyl-ACP methyl ester carboxylesterase